MKFTSQHILSSLVQIGLVAAPLLALLWPESLEPQVATRLLPAVLHTLTLGVFVPLLILRLSQENIGWPRLSIIIAVLLALGLSGFLVGLLSGNRWFYYLGGHYAAPGALYLLSAQAAKGAWTHRKSKGLHQLGWVVLGLFVAVNLGGMLVLDRFYGGKYGFYAPQSILAHGLGALLLFLIPFVGFQVRLEKRVVLMVGLGAVAYTGYLVGWLADLPGSYKLAGLCAGLMVLWIAFEVKTLLQGSALWLGWLLAAVLIVLLPFEMVDQLDVARQFLGVGLYLFFGLVAPLLVNQSNRFRTLGSNHRFEQAAMGLGGLVACLGAWGKFLGLGMALYAGLWLWRFSLGEPKETSTL